LAVPPERVTVLEVVSVVKEPAAAAVPPIAGGLAR
jgi:DNA-binding IscR family transcriptional regulator